jgi:stage III sporulation protein AD
VIKIAAAGLVASIISLQLTKGAKEFQLLISLACGIYILAVGVSKMETIILEVERLMSLIGTDGSSFYIILKCLGITYIADISGGLCQDAGQKAIAEQIEMTGKLTILALSLPIMSSLIETIIGLM